MRKLFLTTCLILASAGGALAASPPANASRVSVVLAEGAPLRGDRLSSIVVPADASPEEARPLDTPRRKVRVILGSPYGN